MNNFILNLMSGEPLCVQIICTLAIGLCTVIIGIGTVIIGYLQWKTNETKRRMDLFEDRYNHLYIPLNEAFHSMTSSIYRDNPELFIKNSEEVIKEINKYSFFIKEKDANELIKAYTTYYHEVIRVGELSQKEAITSLNEYLKKLEYNKKIIYDILTKYLRIEK